eukprot:gene14109-30025_t
MGGIPSQVPKLVDNQSKVLKSSLSQRECRAFSSVDRFIQLLLLQVRREDGMKAIVLNPIALESFVQFLSSHALDNCDQIMSLITNDHQEPLTLSNISGVLKNVLEKTYLFPSTQTSVDQDNCDKSPHLMMMCCEVLPQYLLSDYYDDWRTKETMKIKLSHDDNLLTECTLPDLESFTSCDSTEKISQTPTTASLVFPLVEASIATSVRSKLSSVATTIHVEAIQTRQPSIRSLALSSCDPVEVPTLLKGSGWLTAFITAAETFPIGISVSVVCKQRPGYPVIYVNNSFTTTAGYKREDIIGERFGFMQARGTRLLPESNDGVERITLALGTAVSTVVALKSSTLAGIKFTSIVGVKPILDEWTNYRYVIGIHLQTTFDERVQENLKFVHSIVDVLPHIF